MNIRVKFRKYGCMKFVGHLDVMRFFQKALRRAEMDICYSEGYSPHMLMSFAAPLGVGITSEGEYMDLRMKAAPPSREAVRRLNAVMAEGIDVTSFRLLPEHSKNAMSIVAAADYEVRFREGCGPKEGWQEDWKMFVQQRSFPVVKEGKKGPREMDLRPWIYRMSLEEDAISMQVSAGSVCNVKPELLMQAFAEGFLGKKLSKTALLIHRKELYANLGKDTEQLFVPLEALGEEIE